MLRILLALAATLSLTACEGNDRPGPRPIPAAGPTLSAWEIGPVTPKGGNYSKGLPDSPLVHPEGFAFEIGPTAEPHYVTRRTGSLEGKVIRMRYRVEGPADAIIHGQGCPLNSQSAVTLYFASRDNDWRTDGQRWWATPASVTLAGVGEGEIVVPLDGTWTSVSKMTSALNRWTFLRAKETAARVGFTFANCTGFGHGAVATKPVRFIVTAFDVLDAPPARPIVDPRIGERG